MTRKKISAYPESLFFRLETELKDRLELYCDENKVEISKTIRSAIRNYIDKPKRNEDLEKLKEGVKDEPIVTEPFEIPEEFKEKDDIPEGMTILKISIPIKLMDKIEFIIKKTNLNINNFCAKSFKRYLVELKRRMPTIKNEIKNR